MRIAKIGLYFILSLLTGTSARASIDVQVPELIPFRQGDAWGYSDPAGELRIPVRYDAAMPFRDGSAVVYREGRAGLIDEDGRVLLPTAYDAILNDAMLRLRKAGQYALATRQGKLLTEFAYDLIHAERSGLFLVEAEDQYGMIDTAGLQVVPPRYAHLRILRDDQGNYTDLIQVHHEGKLGLYDRCGNLVADPVYSQISVFRDGFAVAQRDNRFGLLDLEGHEVVPAVYENLHPARQGLAAALVRGRWGFVDVEGREVIPFRYGSVNEAGFFQGRAAVESRGQWSFIDRQGNPEISVEGPYQCLGAMSEGLAPVCVLSDAGYPYYGYLSQNGKLVIPCQYARAYPFQGGFAVVGKPVAMGNSMIKKMRYGIINRKGRIILPLVMASLAETQMKQAALARVGWTSYLHQGIHCKLDEKGKKFACEDLSAPGVALRFAQTKCENKGLIGVARDARWGFCDRRGKEVVPTKYAAVDCFKDGLALVWPEAESELHFYIDATGKEYFQSN